MSFPVPTPDMFPHKPKQGLRLAPHTRPAASPVSKVGLIGMGTVGSAVARILSQNASPRLQLTHVCSRTAARSRFPWLPADVACNTDVDQLLASDVDIVVELVGGLNPAGDWIRRALQAGKSVVTANKQLIAHCGPELLDLAHKMGCQLAFGASVAGGIPVVSALQEGLAGDRLFKVHGILNGTCNYVLSQIEKEQVSFDVAVKEAQRLGFAEADPSEDVDGLDAGAKLAILAPVGLRSEVRVSEIACRTIRNIEAVDFVYAEQLGCTIRQVSRAELHGGDLYSCVQPALVPLGSPLARAQGSQNLVVATGQFGGDTVFSGFGAGGNPTAVAVVSDLIAIAQPQPSAAATVSATRPNKVSSDFVSPQYVRFTVMDRPGIIAVLAAIFSEEEINIDSVLQKPGYPKSALPFVIAFEPCSASALEKALNRTKTLDFLVQPPVSLPILH